MGGLHFFIGPAAESHDTTRERRNCRDLETPAALTIKLTVYANLLNNLRMIGRSPLNNIAQPGDLYEKNKSVAVVPFCFF